MKVNDLSKELNITNKELITFLKKNGFNISSHMQPVNDKMIDLAREKFVKVKESEKKESVEPIVKAKESAASKINIEHKVFKPDDVIPCRSVTPWQVVAMGVDKTTVYNWGYYGDIDYLTYKDLQALRRSEYITKPMIIIEDADLCLQWSRELGDTYKYFLGVDYPEEFFEIPDAEFEEMLKKAPEVFKDVIKVTAMTMIKNENYPTVQKLTLIDNILGTCLKEFL